MTENNKTTITANNTFFFLFFLLVSQSQPTFGTTFSLWLWLQLLFAVLESKQLSLFTVSISIHKKTSQFNPSSCVGKCPYMYMLSKHADSVWTNIFLLWTVGRDDWHSFLIWNCILDTKLTSKTTKTYTEYRLKHFAYLNWTVHHAIPCLSTPEIWRHSSGNIITEFHIWRWVDGWWILRRKLLLTTILSLSLPKRARS